MLKQTEHYLKKIMGYFPALGQLKKWLLGLLLVLAIIIFAISAAVATQGGSRWLVSKAAHLAEVRLGALNGNLLTGLDIASLDYAKNDLQIHAEKVIFRWQPLALFYTSVSVQSFSAENINIHLPAAAKDKLEPEVYEWPSLALPVRVALDNVSLRNIHIQQGEQQWDLSLVSGSLSLGTFRLRADKLLLSNPQVTLTTSGSMGLRYPYPLAVKSHWQYTAADEQLWKGEASIGGDIKKITLLHNLQQPLALSTTGTIAPALQDKKHKPSLQLNSDWSEQNIPAIFMQNAAVQEKVPFLKSLLTMRGHLQLQGWLDNYSIEGDLHSKSAENDFSAELKIAGVYLGQDNGNAPRINWNVDKLQLKSQPLAAANEDEKSFLHLRGNIGISPELKWDFLLEGEHVNLGQVFADWPTDLQLRVASQGEFKNPKQFSLNNGRMAISQLNIQGDVRGVKLLSSGGLDFDGSHWQASDINIALGANQISLKGRADKEVALEWKINAPLLNQIDPGIHGSIISSGLLSTELANSNLPQSYRNIAVQMTTQINQLAWRDYSLGALNASLKSSGDNLYQLTLDAEQVELAGQKMSQVKLDGKGSVEQHNLVGSLQSPVYGALDFNLDSSWKDQQWQGQWRKLALTLKRIPVWSLVSSTPMQADKTHFELNKLCLATDVAAAKVAVKEGEPAQGNLMANALQKATELAATQPPAIQLPGAVPEREQASAQTPSICATLHWKAETGLSLTANAIAVPLRQAGAWLKSEVSLDGSLEAQLSFQALKNKPASGEFHLQSRSAEFVYEFRGGAKEIYPIKRGNIDITLKNNQINSLLEMDWGQYGAINAEAKYLVSEKRIQGKVTATLPDLAPLESLLPAFDDVHGSAAADITIAGAIAQPDITGSLTLSNGRATMPRAGLELKEISLDVSSQTAGLISLNGQLLSGEGRLMLKGILTNLGTEKWHAQGNIFGADINIIKQTQLSANISPNLTFTADAGAINLNGSTEIPWARADVKALPSSATRVSNDVIIVDDRDLFSGQAAHKNAIPFYTNVILYFGDDVLFKGFGLDGGLSGKVNVFKEEGRQMLTTGFVAINKGVYRAYGQELSIERGRLIFQGPYDNPGLDIRAVRTIDAAAESEGFKVGLDIAGTLQNPKSSVFSVPSLEDRTAEMAFLLTGKPVNQLNAADAYTLISAVSGMGVEGGSGIKSDIANFFRIDEFSLKEDKTLDQNSLLIGKSITPKLMVRYVVGLLDQAYTLGMSYQITDKVRVDAESGKKQSVDVIYKIER